MTEFRVGDIRTKVYDNGYPCGNKHKQIYHACVDCSKTRWVDIKHGEPANKRCHSCAAKLKATDEWKMKILEGSSKRWARHGEHERMSNNMKGDNNHFYGKKHSSKTIAIMSKPRTKIEIKPTTDWGYLIGLVLGDGWLNYRKGSYRVGVSSTLPEIVDCFKNVCERLEIHASSFKTCEYYCTEVCAKELYKYLRPCKYKDYHFIIPSQVYKSKTMAYGFLMGFFDAEGGVYKAKGGNSTSIQCWSKHIENLKQVRDLLNKVGINSYLHKEKKQNISARLCISDYGNRCLFRSLVGFRIERKQKRLDDMNRPSGNNYTVEQYEWAMKLKNEGYAAPMIQKITGVNKNTIGVWYHNKGKGHMIRSERRKYNILMNDKEIS